MERDIRLNWKAIVKAAKELRLKKKFTQERLAALAGVSTPTISKFENFHEDLQLGSILSILKTLDLLDEPNLYIKPYPIYSSGFDGIQLPFSYKGKECLARFDGLVLRKKFGIRDLKDSSLIRAARENITVLEGAIEANLEKLKPMETVLELGIEELSHLFK